MLPHFIPSIASTGFSSIGDVSGQGGGGGGTPPTETVSLSGTSSVPVSFFGPFPTWSGSSWEVYNTISLTSGGNITRGTYSSSGILVSSTQWNNITPSQTYYARATSVGTGGDAVAPNSGAALGSWLALSSTRNWTYLESNSSFGGYGQRFFTIKFEIASDSGGSNILATGYYKYQWEGGA